MDYNRHCQHHQPHVRTRGVVAQLHPIRLSGVKAGELLIHELRVFRRGRDMTELIAIQVRPEAMSIIFSVHADQGYVAVDSPGEGRLLA